MDGAAAPAAAAAADVEQQHVCLLFQKVLLRGLDDDAGPAGDPHVPGEERWQRRGEHEVSLEAAS